MEFKIEGLDEFITVVDLNIKRKVNEHSICDIKFYINSSDPSGTIAKLQGLVDSQFNLKCGDSDQFTSIFSGYVSQVDLYVTGIIEVKLKCYSNSKKEDLTPETYIYQDTEKKLGDILKLLEVTSVSPFFLDKGLEGEKIPEVIIQKEETKFSFFRRLVNRYGAVVIPESLTAGEKIWIGKRDGGQPQLKIDDYGVNLKKDHVQPTCILRDTFLELGDKIKLDSGSYYIVENSITYERGVCWCKYILQENYDNLIEDEPKQPPLKFMGEVIKNEDEKMMGRIQISFKEDKCTNKDKFHWFKRLTPYSTKDTGFYFIPPVGEKVIVEFNSIEEPYVLGSLRENAHENFKDPKDQFIKNEFNKEIHLKEKELNISSVFNKIFISLGEEKIELNNDKSGILLEKDKITLQNQKTIIVIDEDIHIAKPDGSEMVLGDKVSIKTKDNSSLNLDNQIEMKSNSDIQMNSNSDINMKSNSGIQMKSSSSIDMEASGSMGMKASGSLTVKSSNVKIK